MVADPSLARGAAGALTPAGRADGSFAGLPSFLAEVAAVAGLETALQLARDSGGTEISVPRKVGPDHWLARSVGLTAATRICDHFAVTDADGRPIAFQAYVPFAGGGLIARTRAELARALEQDGLSTRELVRRFGLSERAVKRLRAKLRLERQGRLDCHDGQGRLL